MSIAASPAGKNWISDPDSNRWDVFTQDSRDPALSWKDNLPASGRHNPLATGAQALAALASGAFRRQL